MTAVVAVLALALVLFHDGALLQPRELRNDSCVPANQVGSASVVSNMARYVGAAVATALAATIYGGHRRSHGQR